jgi:hypothetical protein
MEKERWKKWCRDGTFTGFEVGFDFWCEAGFDFEEETFQIQPAVETKCLKNYL